MPRSMAALVLASLLAALTPVATGAHELGTTRVLIVLAPDGRYTGEVVTDAASLVEKLEAIAEDGVSAAAPAFDERLRALAPVFWSRVRLAFDGQATAPASVEVTVTPPVDLTSAAVAHIRWRGERPVPARALSWTYGWTFAAYTLSVQRADGEPQVTWLDGGALSPPIDVAPSPVRVTWRDTAVRYLWLGFTHIVPLGADHVLFVLGLFLLNPRLRPLLMQVSAFTVAHSITLAAGIYGIVSVPPHIVEPLIAVSIAWVAVENIVRSRLNSSRVAVVFACGLLHGLGFAGVLAELGLPRVQFLTALISFNAGVEVAQLTVVGSALLLVGLSTAQRSWYRERVVIPASLVIAATAVYWTLERL